MDEGSPALSRSAGGRRGGAEEEEERGEDSRSPVRRRPPDTGSGRSPARPSITSGRRWRTVAEPSEGKEQGMVCKADTGGSEPPPTLLSFGGGSGLGNVF